MLAGKGGLGEKGASLSYRFVSDEKTLAKDDLGLK